MQPQTPDERVDKEPIDAPSVVRAKTQRGTLWIGASVAAQAGIGVLVQVLLGRWLTPDDFGRFALFISSTLFFNAIAAGGVRTTLTGKTSESIDSAAPAAFRVSLLFAIAAAAGMAALSPAIAALFGEPALVPLILVGAVAMPLRSFTTVAMPILQARLEFGKVALATTLTTLARYTTVVVLAATGWGAMSLVVGLTVGALVLSLSLVPTTLKTVFHGDAGSANTGQRFRPAPWALLGNVASDGTSRVDYFVLGIFAPTSVVGAYYFAFQLVARVSQLALSVSRTVFFPVLAQIQGDRDRQIRGLYKAGTAFALAGGAGAAVIIATMPAIEQALWDGKWEFVVPAIAILATAMPLQVALTVPEQLLKARSSFRMWSILLLVRAGGLAGTALVASLVIGESLTPTSIAATLGAYLAGEALIEMAYLSRALSFSLWRYWRVVLPFALGLVALGWAFGLVASSTTASPVSVMLFGSVVVGGGLGLASILAAKMGWL